MVVKIYMTMWWNKRTFRKQTNRWRNIWKNCRLLIDNDEEYKLEESLFKKNSLIRKIV